ncbi:MarR family winged helix-turn-helix transcriptional regulator [Hydrogenophaga laconesensis]|uniref:DNA-binding MarR family transcriptional regulator n=1 Tax=Hydrogenophaga laconesensis TaxID=1805971 RepID=A0ABU1V7M8_9BURK|nr:MarR family transcriptional regulator [Hydrogenophaga laconesensis]MDR7093464.1 DNA-binding MarR family transcriptional regulator [Hydrogenophaga laconesensis]
MAFPDRLIDPQRQADLLLYRLYRIHTTAGRLVVHMCESEFGITRREWRILSFLAEREGALSSQLAEHAMLDRARTSRTLSTLAAKKLVVRQPRPSDRREVHVFLSAEGRRLYGEIYPRVAAINRELVSSLDAAQRQDLDAAVDALQTQASRMVAERPGTPLARDGGD